jgi:alkanesulfonate monooxygenase SsuD/methylene tetrahydromethanopterin reductase-like flavin-dependent oxidoreductase (luciferase family)
MRAPSEFGVAPADLYEAAIAQCEFADRSGVHFVRLNEHHGAEDGYLPAPLVLAAAIAGRTQRMAIRITILPLPLHDPLRVAEDAAVVDLIARGRLELVVAGGYLRREFEMFGRHLSERGALLEEGVAALRAAWSGERFHFRGRTVRVTPRPYSRPGIPIGMGGSSEAAARRAARLADSYLPATSKYDDVYRAEYIAVTGYDPGPVPARFPLRFLMVARDPAAMWDTVGPHLLHDANTYAAWTAGETHSNYSAVKDLAALRAGGSYRIMSPDECVAWCRTIAPAPVELQPLLGGMPPELGWSSLKLFVDEVMPRLELATVIDP